MDRGWQKSVVSLLSTDLQPLSISLYKTLKAKPNSNIRESLNTSIGAAFQTVAFLFMRK